MIILLRLCKDLCPPVTLSQQNFPFLYPTTAEKAVNIANNTLVKWIDIFTKSF